MSQHTIHSRPIYSRIFDPLYDVVINKSIPAPSRQPLYLKLIKQSGEPQSLAYTRDKLAATSLDELAQSFTTLTPTNSQRNFKAYTLGDQIYQEIHCHSEPRIAATYKAIDKEKLYGFVNVMTSYLNSYRETLCFKVGMILARIFPCLFTSPEVTLQDRLHSVVRIRTFLEHHYGPQTVPLTNAAAPVQT